MTNSTRPLPRTRAVLWPDTTGHDQPPTNHLYASAAWLLGRHPALAALAQRIPGVVTLDDDGPSIDLDLLARTINDAGQHALAWQHYAERHPAPDTDEYEGQGSYEAWCDAGPQPARRTASFLPMSRSERARLVLLAAFSDYEQVPFSVSQLYGLDDTRRRLLDDWCRAVRNA
jgi:hypothetical protein